MKQNQSEEQKLKKNDGPWQRVSGRRDKNGRLIESGLEKWFPDRRAVDLGVDLAEPAAIRALVAWVPQLEAERAGWADRKAAYIVRALARPRDAYHRRLIQETLDHCRDGGKLDQLRERFAAPRMVLWLEPARTPVRGSSLHHRGDEALQRRPSAGVLDPLASPS